MACMTHECPKCDYFEVNNNPKETKCPKCGAVMRRSIDE